MDALTIINVINFVTSLLGKIAGGIGLLLLGLAVTWLLVATLKKSDYPWQFMLGMFAVFFLFAGVIMWREPPIMVGAYALGVAGGFWYWGREKKAKEVKPEEPK